MKSYKMLLLKMNEWNKEKERRKHLKLTNIYTLIFLHISHPHALIGKSKTQTCLPTGARRYCSELGTTPALRGAEP